ncbi:retinol dehydrogenase 8-like [Ptychodera flava]|uniref:retinol dehydrogenase 8-like n=1 Tax=Ptychodera flava TaxID=63121 RepID=UPI00396A6EEB
MFSPENYFYFDSSTVLFKATIMQFSLPTVLRRDVSKVTVAVQLQRVAFINICSLPSHTTCVTLICVHCSVASMSKKIVVITGCSSGIGLETALQMAKARDKPYKVYATMRNLGKRGEIEKRGKDMLNKTLFVRDLDVNKDESVDKFFTTLIRDEGRIDILINNAGVVQIGILETCSLNDIRDVMETNFFGAVRTIHAILSVMKRQGSGRIINVSSVVGICACPFTEGYSASKFALEGFSEALAPTLRKFNINLSTIQFGPVDTAWRDREDEMFARVKYDRVDDKTGQLMRDYRAARDDIVDPAKSDLQTVEEAAKFLVWVVEDNNPKLIYPSSDFVTGILATKLKDLTGESVVASADKSFLRN